MHPESLNFKLILAFFLPLIFMTEMHQISHSMVHAFLARLSNPTIVLAAFSIAFTFNMTISAANQVSVQGGISFITDRAAFWQLFRFSAAVSICLFIIIESIAWTPMGDYLFGQWMRASEAVVEQARITSAIMGLWLFPVMIRNLGYALSMVQRRTILITKATLVRLIALVFFLFFYSFWLDGAPVGGAALVSCMTVEAIYIVFVSYPLLAGLEKRRSKIPSYREIWRFSWPLMITQGSESSVPLVINFFVGQLSNSDLALAGFGVVYGLVRTLLSPVRNLVQTTQTLVHSRQELKPMFQFTLQAVLFFVALVALFFFSPLREVILKKIMGLTPELSAYVTPGIKLAFLTAIFWGYAAMLRGTLSAMRRTGDIALSVPIRIATVAAVCSVALFFQDLNGATIGILALSGAFASETIFLALRLRYHFRVTSNLFLHSEA